MDARTALTRRADTEAYALLASDVVVALHRERAAAMLAVCAGERHILRRAEFPLLGSTPRFRHTRLITASDVRGPGWERGGLEHQRACACSTDSRLRGRGRRSWSPDRSPSSHRHDRTPSAA